MYDYDRSFLGSIHVPNDFERAKEVRDQLEAETDRTDKALKALSGGGARGLTPDHIKATPEWKKAKQDFDKAFAALRSFNEVYVRRFKEDLARDRRMRRR